MADSICQLESILNAIGHCCKRTLSVVMTTALFIYFPEESSLSEKGLVRLTVNQHHHHLRISSIHIDGVLVLCLPLLGPSSVSSSSQPVRDWLDTLTLSSPVLYILSMLRLCRSTRYFTKLLGLS